MLVIVVGVQMLVVCMSRYALRRMFVEVGVRKSKEEQLRAVVYKLTVIVV